MTAPRFSTLGESSGSSCGVARGRGGTGTIEYMNNTQVVTVRGLRKAYRSRVVVDGLDLDVPAGEIVGLIGANGAGKTTTVECIQGLRKPDAGTLRVLGYDPVTQAEELRPLIGSQLQDSALPDRLRVAEAVTLFGTARTRDGGELLEQFGVGQRRRSAFASLSGGERQRLFLVLALLNRPRLVILDALTQGLDPAARPGGRGPGPGATPSPRCGGGGSGPPARPPRWSRATRAGPPSRSAGPPP